MKNDLFQSIIWFGFTDTGKEKTPRNSNSGLGFIYNHFVLVHPIQIMEHVQKESHSKCHTLNYRTYNMLHTTDKQKLEKKKNNREYIVKLRENQGR